MQRNYRLTIAYDGSRYFGWEHQPGQITIQGTLEEAFMAAFSCDFPEIQGAGRTDAGVHARQMCANVWLDLASSISVEEMRDALNQHLPEDIRILRVQIAAAGFHARYSAVGKTYEYSCYVGEVHRVFGRKYVYDLTKQYETKPDLAAMQEAAKILIGKHDYAAFCKNASSYESTVRVIDTITIGYDAKDPGLLRMRFHGTGFMRNMVRILAGTLICVGYEKMTVEDVAIALEAKDRGLAGYTAPPQGLCLLEVDYS